MSRAASLGRRIAERAEARRHDWREVLAAWKAGEDLAEDVIVGALDARDLYRVENFDAWNRRIVPRSGPSRTEHEPVSATATERLPGESADAYLYRTDPDEYSRRMAEAGAMHGPPEDANRWAPLPFLELASAPVEPPQIAGLFYLGKRHILSGEADLGKTWIALWAAAQEIHAGHSVVWVNTDEAPPAELLERLTLFGVTREQLDASWIYLQPEYRSDPQEIAALVGEVAEHGARLVVVDSFNPAMMLEGLDPLSTVEVDTFWRRIAGPFAKAGAGVVLIDHLPKSSENHGRYSYGSERKLSGADVHIGARGKGFSREDGGGSVTLENLKDRTGYLPKGKIGRFKLTVIGGSMAEGEIMSLSEDEREGRLTAYMLRVSRALEAHRGEALTTAQIVEAVGGNRQHVLTALRDLCEAGNVSRTREGRGYVYTLSQPYTEGE